MKMTKYIAAGGAILIGVVSLALAQDKPVTPKASARASGPTNPPPPPAHTNAINKTKFPVLGYLQGRGQTIIIKAGAKGPVYSVRGTDGKLLFEDLTVEQLRAQAPEIHQFIKSAVAVNTRGAGPTADASLRFPER